MTEEWPGWPAHIASHQALDHYPAGRTEAVFDTDGFVRIGGFEFIVYTVKASPRSGVSFKRFAKWLKKRCHHKRVAPAETIELNGDHYAVFLFPVGPLPAARPERPKERWTWI